MLSTIYSVNEVARTTEATTIGRGGEIEGVVAQHPSNEESCRRFITPSPTHRRHLVVARLAHQPAEHLVVRDLPLVGRLYLDDLRRPQRGLDRRGRRGVHHSLLDRSLVGAELKGFKLVLG